MAKGLSEHHTVGWVRISCHPYYKTAIVILLTLLDMALNVATDSATVTLSDGLVRGRIIQVQNKQIAVFLGIPFAEPPVGELRYKHPVRNQPWQGVLNATRYGDTCMQMPDTTFPGFAGSEIWNPPNNLSEDCLYVNVWAPYPLEENAPVLEWIYGGGFTTGSPALKLYNGAQLAAATDVVVVSINYRVGSFGFLYLGTPDAPGNAGLYDQLLAMQWVHENIDCFGGDPEQITLFGESAGAASVGFHLLSPLSEPFFNRAILQSGTPLSPWALIDTEAALQTASFVAEYLQCNKSTSRETLACMQEQLPWDILISDRSASIHNTTESNLLLFPFVPVIDGVIVVDEPQKLLEKGFFKKTDIFLGGNRNEGSFWLIYFFPEYFSKDHESLIDYESYLSLVALANKQFHPIARDAIAFEYQDWINPHNGASNRFAIDEVVGDQLFLCPVTEFAEYYSRDGQTVYMYFFDYVASSEPWPDWMGTIHGAEIQWIFGQPLNVKSNFTYTSEEVDLSLRVMDMVTNFAKVGNPADDWPKWLYNEQYYVIMDLKWPPDIGMGLKEHRCAFWSKYLPQLQQSLVSERISREYAESSFFETCNHAGSEINPEDDENHWLEP